MRAVNKNTVFTYRDFFIQYEEDEPLSTFTLNASRSYNHLHFIYARKVSQMLLRNLRKIYATVEIHLYGHLRNTVTSLLRPNSFVPEKQPHVFSKRQK